MSLLFTSFYSRRLFIFSGEFPCFPCSQHVHVHCTFLRFVWNVHVQKHGYHLPVHLSVLQRPVLPLLVLSLSLFAFNFVQCFWLVLFFSEWTRLWLMFGSELLWHVRSKLFGQLPVTWMQCYKIVRLTRCEPFQTQCTANACQTCRHNQLVSFIRFMIQ